MQKSLVETIRSQFDKKDRAILSALDQDARINNSVIAKELGISKQSVAYRIQKLKDNKVIGRFLTIFNFRRLGYDAYYVHLELQGASPKDQKEIIKWIGKQTTTVWLLETYGRPDIVFVILAKSAAIFNKELKKILSKFHHFVAGIDFVVGLDASYGRKNYLPESPESIYDPNPQIQGASYQPDSLDLTIMNELFENPLASIVDISQAVGSRHETVSSRIKKLQDENVLLKFTFELNPAVVKYEWHLLYLAFDLRYIDQEEKLKKFLGVHPNVTFFVDVVGDWNLQIDLHVIDTEHLYQLIHELKKEFPELIRKFESFRVANVHKCSFLPKKLFGLLS